METKIKFQFKALLISFLGLISGLNGFAQDEKDANYGTIINKTDIKVHLAEAVKLDVVPVSDNIKIEKPKMSYTTDPYLVPSPPFKTKLVAFSLGSPPTKPLERFFIKGAFGNYSNLYGELFYNTLRSRTDLLSVDVKHHSGDANGAIQNGDLKGSTVKNSAFSTDAIDLYGSHIFGGKYNLTGSLGYNSDGYNYYSLIPDSLKPKNAPQKQIFNDFHIKANFENTGADTGKLRYKMGLGYISFSDNYKTAENDIKASLTLIQPIHDNFIKAEASYENINNQNVEFKQNRSILKINTGYQIKTGILRAYIGLKTANESADSGIKAFHFYPDLRIDADLVDKYLTVFGGITGNLDENTYRNFAYENPFINSTPKFRNSNDKFDIFGGIKGSFSSTSSYLVRVAYKNYSNYYFYVQDTSDKRKFVILYDTGNTTILNLHGELAFSIMENINFSTKLDLNSYSTSTIKQAYERPGFQWMITGDYNLDNKIIFGADVFLVGSRTTTDLAQKQITTLKPFVDMNAHVSYSFENVKGLKVFVELNNIFGNQYQIWNNYPVRGFQVLGGAMFSF